MPFENPYSNKLDLSKALENKDKCLELIKDFYGYNGPIETGGFYIMPDGTAVKSANHLDIDKLLIRYHYIKHLDREPMQYGDGSQFMDALNCVRIRRRGGKDAWILPYIILPEEKLTDAQYDVIENWIDFVLAKSGQLSIQTADGKYKYYKSTDVAKDIIFEIKKYYVTHVWEHLEEDLDLKTTKDIKLIDAINKGYFNQF